MTIYYTALNVFLLVTLLVLIRFSWYRFCFFLQIFQQSGYKRREYTEWLNDHMSTRVVTKEHVIITIGIFALLYFTSGRLTMTAAAIVLGIFVLSFFGSVSSFRPEKDKKPLVFTPRLTRLAVTLALLILPILVMTVLLAMTGQFFNSNWSFSTRGIQTIIADPYILILGIVMTDIFLPILLIPASWLMSPVEWSIQNGFKKSARARLEEMPDLKIIAVTGSYGKTSTKFMISALLKERYNVCVTPGSYNTPMGICKVINEQLEAHHQILILEMGARYPGNILELCDIATPDLAVITNIGTAHLKTFGSVDIISKEKRSLADALSRNGRLIINGDDERLTSASYREDVNVTRAGLTRGSVRAEQIHYNENGTRFKLILDESDGQHNPVFKKEPSLRGNPETITEPLRESDIELRLLGAHNIENFLLAAAVARVFSIRPETIALAGRQLEPVEHRLELRKQNGLTIIDDAFNSNPVGARNAVEILASFSTGRRIIITPGMIELGDLQEEENREFGRTIAKAGLDLVILVGAGQTEPIQQGIRDVGTNGLDLRIVNSLYEANRIVMEYATEGDVILYENDLPDTFNE